MEANEQYRELFKAEKITDITDEYSFSCILDIICCNKTIIKNGFIYIESDINIYVLLFARLDEIQRIYEITKQCLLITGEPTENYYEIRPDNTTIAGAKYLMFGGHFTLITSGRKLFEHGDLLFTAPINRAVAYTDSSFIADDYYTVPINYNQVEAHFGPANPIITAHKFKKHYNYRVTDNKMYVVIRDRMGEKMHYVADPFDSELSFLCDQTYDLINVVTGHHTPTWPLKHIATGRDEISMYIDKIPPAINVGEWIVEILYYDEKWDTYHYGMSNYRDKLVIVAKAGKNTKMDAIAE